MRVVVWVVEGTWRSCVDAARDLAPADAEMSLVYVVDDEVSKVAHGAFAGLIGRGRRERDPGLLGDDITAESAKKLLARAAERLQLASTSQVRHGRVEREVVAAADGAGLLVVARDGDQSRLGPRSLGHAARFVVDHAPCPVLLVWPETTPEIATIPPPPDHPHPKHPGPHGPPPPPPRPPPPPSPRPH
jgi:nucleotide-binding universal stress UspA family protein